MKTIPVDIKNRIQILAVKINVRRLPNGIYFLKILESGTSNISIEKFIIMM